MTVPTDLDAASATPPTARACSTSPTTWPTRRSASCWSPRPTAASAGSPTGPTTPSTSSPATSASRVLRVPRRVDGIRRELDEYFEGRRQEFDLRLDLTPVADFHRRALDELARVPYGQVTTYGALAAEVGRPKAARAIGGAMNRNPIPIVLPCHRVVGAGGSLVGYAGGLERKELLLRLEGALL